jgi:hypothetical protein
MVKAYSDNLDLFSSKAEYQYKEIHNKEDEFKKATNA